MTPKLYKVAEVCEIAQVQPYVLRSWEKEFPGIGLQKSDETRLYRQSDVDQVLRIKQLVFGEGLTVSGARRRLEQSAPVAAAAAEAEAIEVLGADARKRIGYVRDGLKSLLQMLNGGSPGFELKPPPPPTIARRRASAQRIASPARSKKVVSARGKSTTAARGKSTSKRKRATA